MLTKNRTDGRNDWLTEGSKSLNWNVVTFFNITHVQRSCIKRGQWIWQGVSSYDVHIHLPCHRHTQSLHPLPVPSSLLPLFRWSENKSEVLLHQIRILIHFNCKSVNWFRVRTFEWLIWSYQCKGVTRSKCIVYNVSKDSKLIF